MGKSILKITCPECGKRYKGDENLYGYAMTCHVCKGQIVVLDVPSKDPRTGDIKFNCPRCNQHLKSTAALCGHKIPCPNCKVALLIPKVQEEKEQTAMALNNVPA